MPRIPVSDQKIPHKFQNAGAPLALETYDGSGETTHPDVIYIKESFQGYKFWMVNTPYPALNDDFENPSIWCSNDGETWVIPDGLTNPIVPAPSNPAFHSDPCMVYAGGKLWVYYRQNTGVGANSSIRVITSSDGVTWGEWVEIGSFAVGVASPQIHYEETTGEFWLWYVRHNGCSSNFISLVKQTSTDGVNFTDVGNTYMGFLSSNEPWHINFKRYNNRFYGVFCAFPSSCTNDQKLYFVKSIDYAGNGFEMLKQPILTPAGTGWDDHSLYQSCLLNVEGTWHLWYSGRTASTGGGLGHTTL